MPTLTKASLADQLEQHVGLEVKSAMIMVESFFEELICALENKEDVKLTGLGNFKVRHKKSRPGRNPKTGEEIAITARSIVSFRPGVTLKNQVVKIRPQKPSIRNRKAKNLANTDHHEEK